MADVQPVVYLLDRVDHQIRQAGDLADVVKPALGNLKNPLPGGDKPPVPLLIDHHLIHGVVDLHLLDPDLVILQNGDPVIGAYPDGSVFRAADIIDTFQLIGIEDLPVCKGLAVPQNQLAGGSDIVFLFLRIIFDAADILAVAPQIDPGALAAVIAEQLSSSGYTEQLFLHTKDLVDIRAGQLRNHQFLGISLFRYPADSVFGPEPDGSCRILCKASHFKIAGAILKGDRHKGMVRIMKQSLVGRSDPQRTVLPAHQVGDSADLFLEGLKLLAVIPDQPSVSSDPDQPVLCLCDCRSCRGKQTVFRREQLLHIPVLIQIRLRGCDRYAGKTDKYHEKP